MFIDSEIQTPFNNFRIYDRWGNKVFDRNSGNTGDISFGWNGMMGNNPAEDGVYVYYLILELEEGERMITGDVSLIR